MDRLRAAARTIDPLLYGVFAAAVTLAFARAFYGYMRVQTGGEWSAPLDDVFIHFDYARSIARGHPFEWSEGNGYSSGNGSITYPFVLAAGYWAGFRGNSLVIWSGMVACASMVAFLLGARRLFGGLPLWAKYLAPLFVYSIGAVGGSMFSGMELAFFLGVWGAALVAKLAVIGESDPRLRIRREWLLGASGILLVLTRPEGAISIAVLGIGAAIALRGRGMRATLSTLFRTGFPAVLALVVLAGVNRWLTGESASSDAISKLAIYNPFLTTGEKLEQYRSLIEYAVVRNIEYHFADSSPYGFIVPLLAVVPFTSRKTRGAGALLWASSLSWIAVVSLNGQMRWQSERYTMPATAWILLAAALGVGVLLSPWFSWRSRTWPQLLGWSAKAVGAVVLVALFLQHQAPRMREQIWLFGRASRNIRDQQMTVGRLLRRLEPTPRRVLVGDAGAITYAADLPGLDLLGLGGFGKLPFARAHVHGIGASLELLERLGPDERPDYFALSASSWGNFPSWFGSFVVEVPVHGDVIGSGAEQVVYRASFRGFGTSQFPRTIREDEEITDELDVGDLISEREHDYEACLPKATVCPVGDEGCQISTCGLTDARLLADPVHPGREMFDAGRHIYAHHVERFRLKRRPDAPARLIVRTAGDRPAMVDVRIDGEDAGRFEIPLGGWQELTLPLPETPAELLVELVPKEGGWVNHHVWIVQPR